MRNKTNHVVILLLWLVPLVAEAQELDHVTNGLEWLGYVFVGLVVLVILGLIGAIVFLVLVPLIKKFGIKLPTSSGGKIAAILGLFLAGAFILAELLTIVNYLVLKRMGWG